MIQDTSGTQVSFLGTPSGLTNKLEPDLRSAELGKASGFPERVPHTFYTDLLGPRLSLSFFREQCV